MFFPTPCPSPGGGWGPSLGQPKFFCCGSLCCCGALPLVSLVLMAGHLLTFTEMDLDSTTMFPPGTNVMFIRSTGEPVLAQVIGHSEHSDALMSAMARSYAEFFRFMLQFRCLQVCVYGGSAVPRGGGGG